MKHRTINKVRTIKVSKVKRQRRSNGISDVRNNVYSSVYTKEYNRDNIPAWNSKLNGTYVKKLHGKLK